MRSKWLQTALPGASVSDEPNWHLFFRSDARCKEYAFPFNYYAVIIIKQPWIVLLIINMEEADSLLLSAAKAHFSQL